jgi:hypothetical protein
MRRAASVLLYRALGLAWVLALSCSDGGGRADIFGSPAPHPRPDALPGSGGTTEMPGASAQAGQPSTGGAQGGSLDFGSEASSGTGGQRSGSAGDGGMSIGGSATAGHGGGGASVAGSASHAGSAGTAPMGGVGTGGGGAGSSGSGPSFPAPKTCAEACKITSDCRIGNQDYGFTCNPATHRCEKPLLVCQSSLECLPNASFWFLDCDSDADCFYFDDDACVSVAGVGKCARLAPGPSSEASGCELPTADAVTLPRFGGGGSVLVCADGRQRCEHGDCVGACRAHADCSPARNGSVCDFATGVCRCVKDQDCGDLGVSRCNLTTGRCECSGDTDCEELADRDVCVEGQCACSSAAACNGDPLFASTKLVCE